MEPKYIFIFAHGCNLRTKFLLGNRTTLHFKSAVGHCAVADSTVSVDRTLDNYKYVVNPMTTINDMELSFTDNDELTQIFNTMGVFDTLGNNFYSKLPDGVVLLSELVSNIEKQLGQRSIHFYITACRTPCDNNAGGKHNKRNNKRNTKKRKTRRTHRTKTRTKKK